MSWIGDKADAYFGISERGSTLSAEIRGGAITFLSMSYILVVNPYILGPAAEGYTFSQLFTATALASIVACVLMGGYSRFPMALAPGMGVNAFLSYTICLGMGFSFEQGLMVVLISGALFFLITVTGLRARIIDAIPVSMKLAITAGIGLFISIIGLFNSGIISHGAASALSFGVLSDPGVLLSIFCLVVTVALWFRGHWFAVIGGMASAWALGMCLTACGIGSEYGLLPVLDAGGMVSPPDFALFGKVFTEFSFIEGGMLVPFIAAVVSLFVVDMFDTTGTLIGVGSAAGMVDGEGRIAGGDRAMVSDAVGSVVGAVCGTCTTTSFVESVTGIESGARTGILPLVVATLFAASFLISGFFATFTSACTVGALVLVGILMIKNVVGIDWRDPVVCASSFLTIFMMGFTGSITNGIAIGVFVYTAGALLTGRKGEVSGVMYVLTAVFLLYFVIIYGAIPNGWV